MGKIKTFRDLNAWKESHVLVLEIYKTTKKFPKDEIYDLTNQIRRCAVSISSNIAEGFSRQGSKEKIQFYFVSRGSLTELQNQIIIAHDIGYISKGRATKIYEQSVTVSKLLSGLIKSASTR